MSKENVQKFYASIKDDEKINQKVLEAAAAGNIVEYAREKGFEFTKEEYDEFISEISTDTSEIPDDQLDKVAGGFDLHGDSTSQIRTVMCKQCGWKSGWGVKNSNVHFLEALHCAKTGHTKYKVV
ncbi:Nif11-like leader peptide family RiPP precursor [Clostridium sp. AWRP]|uniref:Nif11-like leader peptide family RiPP precursor n=1 Tax=Clostridium sp. AWRP TaxID=2212991 RepID=UPI0015866DE5|nr:Nif11-like leader peptide family RiPP precursor [Clostridium sp. AWRP]